ncbi:hypothetical protein ACFC60_26220 [Kitasatospora purpeofusca]|uniref:hypothetical protein n=1 Tax=Kitasatospora purpeofusca TaxID=67352 RepID=UPI0035DD69B3
MSSTLKSGEALATEENLTSSNGRFQLIFQNDGNLVLADLEAGGVVVWNSASADRGATEARMQEDGNFILFDPSGEAQWATGTDGNDGACVSVTDDGNVVITRDGDGTLWETGPHGTATN